MNLLKAFIGNFLYFILPVLILIGLFKLPWFKGFIGEFQVNLAAILFLNRKEYTLLKNVTLPTEEGSTQIDHIIVSRYGIFVVETKSIKGWIFGSERQRSWTQKIYKYTKKFQNPLRQNYKHIKTLQSLLNLEDHQVFSVIVFVGDSTFKTKMPDNVTYAGGYLRYIKSKKQPVLSEIEVEQIISSIEAGKLTSSFKTHKEHVKHVKEMVSKKEINITCPKCESPMTVKNGKYGQFYGCSTFPKCKGTRKL